MDNFLEIRGLTKRFPGVIANDNVHFDVRPGEVHAILGENGAGKSTLMKQIYGLYQPDEGQIFIAGEAVRFASPREAIRSGIGMVHQHFMLIPALTVTENVVLGDEPGFINFNKKQAVKSVRELSETYKLNVNPTAKVSQLSVGLQQRVEILKAFYRKAKLLILDEPTALLTPQETEELFQVIRHLQSEGVPIVFISHKLDEIKNIANRVTIMRAGKTVQTLDVAGTTPQELANLMVGREVNLHLAKEIAKVGRVLLDIRQVAAIDGTKKERVHDVTLQVHQGEIVGLAGIDGNGQFELVDAIAGIYKTTKGTVQFDGQDITRMSPEKRTKLGIAYVPQDRQLDGLVLDFDLIENTILRDFKRKPFSQNGFLRFKAARDYANRLIAEFDVRPTQSHRKAGELSGGNQQKVILAREVSRSPKLLIAAQPTRGLDVGAIEGIHKQLLRLRDTGQAVLLVSLELDEIMNLSDRIAVIHDGRIVDIIDGSTATRQQIGLLMTGVRTESQVTD